jgi:hypothetical protein
LVGLLTIAGLAACGDKVTVPPPVSPVQDNTVHSVTVSPAQVSLPVGQKVTLAVSVDAGAGVQNRGVTWSSSNTAVATVGTDGTVTGVTAGTSTIIAKSAADPTVSGASAVTVTGGGVPTVTISSLNTTVCTGVSCSSVPANLSNFGTASGVPGATGQLDVILNVDSNGQVLKSVDVTLTCGTKTMTRSQTITSPPATAAEGAEEAAAPVTISLPTTEFNPTTGATTLTNGACNLAAKATTASGTQTAATNTPLTLNNADGAVVTMSTNGNSANDVNGLPWKSGAVTVGVVPVIYTAGRTIATASITLPGLDAVNGAHGSTLSTTTAPFSVTFPNVTSNTTARVGQVTLTGGLDAAGLPKTVLPQITLIDAAGNDTTLTSTSFLQGSTAGVRLDNQSPNAPTTFQIPARQQSWINAAYTFAGTSGTQGSQTGKYVSGGDAGVGNAANSNGVNPSNTLTWFFGPAATFTPLSGGTDIGANCVTTGLTQAATGNDIPTSTTNTQFIVRVLETDKLGNVRCMDLGTSAALAGGTLATTGTFGVDKQAPTATFINPTGQPVADVNFVNDNDPCPFVLAGVQQVPTVAVPCGNGGAVIKNYGIATSDDASGTGTKPATTMLTRLNATGGQTCVIGSGSSCTAFDTVASGIPANGGGSDGYYTYTATVHDLARNNAPTLTRVVLVDQAAPTLGGIAVPATITGGAAASFATSATDNVDLVKVNYTLAYPAISIRTPAADIGVAFDNVLTTTASFNLTVPSFIRSIVATGGGNAPQAGGAAPTSITVRVYDAAGNQSAPGTATIAAANVPLTNLTNFAAPQPNTAVFSTFAVANAATNISNGPTTPAANPTTVSLVAQATGTEGSNFQFLNPFTQVQFYYQDPVSTEFIFIGSATAPVVTDNATATVRTFTWTFPSWDPPASLPLGAVSIVALGVNSLGDGLVSAINTNITLTNP